MEILVKESVDEMSRSAARVVARTGEGLDRWFEFLREMTRVPAVW
jgi:hypothetical protein